MSKGDDQVWFAHALGKSHQYVDESKPHVTGNIEWLYVHRHKPPRGRKLHILTRGRVSIQGPWEDGMGYIAWQHMFKRNKKEEAEAEAFVKG